MSGLQTNGLIKANKSWYGCDTVMTVEWHRVPGQAIPMGKHYTFAYPFSHGHLQRNELIFIKFNLLSRLSKCTMSLPWGLACHLEIKWYLFCDFFHQNHWNLTKVVEVWLCQVRWLLIVREHSLMWSSVLSSVNRDDSWFSSRSELYGFSNWLAGSSPFISGALPTCRSHHFHWWSSLKGTPQSCFWTEHSDERGYALFETILWLSEVVSKIRKQI